MVLPAMNVSHDILGLIEAAKRAPTPVTSTSNLFADLGFDSLGFVRLLLKVEETFAIGFDLMEMSSCQQVDRLIALVSGKIKEAGYDSALVDQATPLG